MIFAIDFDGTIVEQEFPNIGQEMPHAFRVLKRMKDFGHKLILFTCREDICSKGRYLSQAIDYCLENGLEFDAINTSILGLELDMKWESRKPHYDFLIDDRNFCGVVCWEYIERELEEMGEL